MVKILNYTPLVLNKKTVTAVTSSILSKEKVPFVPKEVAKSFNASEFYLEEKVAEKKELNLPQGVETVPESIELDKDLEQIGVEAVNEEQKSIFLGTKKINLPLNAQNVIQGQKKPATSGWRWLSELTLYLLHKAHYGIRKIAGQFQFVANA